MLSPAVKVDRPSFCGYIQVLLLLTVTNLFEEILGPIRVTHSDCIILGFVVPSYVDLRKYGKDPHEERSSRINRGWSPLTTFVLAPTNHRVLILFCIFVFALCFRERRREQPEPQPTAVPLQHRPD